MEKYHIYVKGNINENEKVKKQYYQEKKFLNLLLTQFKAYKKTKHIPIVEH